MDDLSRTYAALADPTRRAILARLADGPASFTELATPFEISKPAVVKHLKALEAAGLVAREAAGARARYRAEPNGLEAPADWLERQRRFWNGGLDRLEEAVREITEGEGGKA